MMKAGERPNSKLLRGGRQESRRFRLLAIVVGFFIVSLTFVLVSKPDAILFGRKFLRRRAVISNFNSILIHFSWRIILLLRLLLLQDAR